MSQDQQDHQDIAILPNNSWDRLPEETDHAWQAFEKYLAYPTRPRLTARKWAEETHMYAVPTIVAWSAPRLYDWRPRAYDYDMFIAGLDKDAVADKRERQVVVLDDEAEDYVAMRDIWGIALASIRTQLKANQVEEAIENLNRLALARQRIDNLGRRASELPSTYKHIPKDKSDDEDNRDILIDWDTGPGYLPEEVNNDDPAP